MNRDKVLSFIGLATKAGKVVSGEFSVEKAVKSDQAFLVMVAKDASDNTKKMFQNMCDYRSVPIVYYGSKESLGQAMGKQMRVSVAFLDEGFANAVRKQLAMEKTESWR